jgi:outer membrane protein
MSKNMKKMMMAMSLALASVAPLTQAASMGVIDLERVVEGSTYLKQQNTAFQQKIQPQTTKIEQLSKELEALQQRAQSNTKLSETEKQKMSAQYQAKLQELNQLQQSVQTNVQSSIQQIRIVFDARVKQIAEQLRRENNLDVVLNKNSALAYDAKYDLTDKMIQKVNAIK